MQGSGPANPIASELRIGKRPVVRSPDREYRIEHKNKKGAIHEDRSLFWASIKRLLDLAIARDLGRGGDGRSYLDLGALHLRKPTGSFARRNPVILHFLEILANVSIVKASGL